MRKIGMIGGLSWVSTAEYYKRLNELMAERLGGVHSVRIALESVERQAYVDAVIEHRDEAAACEIILDAAKGVERAGADFIVISCNDVHRFVPEIAPQVAIPFLHIAEATARAVTDQGLGAVGLLGVMKTMEGTFYPDVLAEHGIATLVPDEPDRTYVHDKIYEELVKDRFTDETRDGYRAVIDNLARRGAEGVILGCTEIPLLLGPNDVDLPAFSTTELHCRAAVDTALAG
jgi:aspartate racemase